MIQDRLMGAARRAARALRGLVAPVAFAALAAAPAAAAGNSVWFAPESHFPPAQGSDFLDLFDHPEAWSQALRHVQVFQLSTQFFQKAPPGLVTKVVRFLASHDIALAVGPEFTCGKVPGTPVQAQVVVDKLRAAGGAISYLAMDEPYWWVHAATAPTAAGCRLPLDQAMARVKDIVGVYTAAFPNVTIGDVEPFPAVTNDPQWKSDYADWLKAFEGTVGSRIRFLHLDFNWREPRLTRGGPDVSDPRAVMALARETAAFARTKGLAVGVIVNGKANAGSDAEWVQQAAANGALFNEAGIKPDQVLFESWHKHPLKMLPDTDPSTFTGYIVNTVRP